jgi:hypothetical protein
MRTVLLGLKWSGALPRSEYSLASGHMQRNTKAGIPEIVRLQIDNFESEI